MVVWDPVAPREQTGVDRGSHDLALQSLKGDLLALWTVGLQFDVEILDVFVMSPQLPHRQESFGQAQLRQLLVDLRPKELVMSVMVLTRELASALANEQGESRLEKITVRWRNRLEVAWLEKATLQWMVVEV